MFLRWGLTDSYVVKSLTKHETKPMDPAPFDTCDASEKPKLPFRSIALKGMSPIKLRLYDLRSDESKESDLMVLEPVPPFASVNVLKSNLQKCIRRQEVDKGLRTAKRWLRCDPTSFLRRWPIILVEDALPTSTFPGLIWLMVAVTSCDYLLTATDAAFIMDTVYEAFGHDIMLDICKQRPIAHPDFHTLASSHPFVQAMWIRVAYGGMGGDRAMLAGLVDHYTPSQGFIPPSLRSPPPKPRVLQPVDILEVSKDFHVFPRLLDTLSGTLGMDPDEIKKTIWAHASGVTCRKSIDGSVLEREIRLAALQEETKETWRTIKDNKLYG